MKLGKEIKYKGEKFEIKAVKTDGDEIIYLIGKPEWHLTECIELKKGDFK